MSSQRLKDKAAVVTGAGRGIGRAIALLFAEEGAKVVVNDLGGERNGSGAARAPADQVVNEIREHGGEAVANYDSVATAEGGEDIIKTAVDSFGRLDILVNNAGFLRDRMVFNMTDEEWDDIVKVILYGAFYCTRPAARIFRAQKSGRIISMSSESGLGTMGQTNYGSAKEGLAGFTRCLARDLGKYGVTANAIRPRAESRLTMTDELREAREKAIKAGIARAGPKSGVVGMLPEDIAPFVVFLCLEEAANINGYDFMVGGGDIALFSQPQMIKTIHKQERWTVDELIETVPVTIGKDLVNPVPSGK